MILGEIFFVDKCNDISYDLMFVEDCIYNDRNNGSKVCFVGYFGNNYNKIIGLENSIGKGCVSKIWLRVRKCG